MNSENRLNIDLTKYKLYVCVYTCLVGGLAGAASRITGAMAKGVAAITMDEEYQQKRREAMNKQPSGLREGLTRGGKGLVSVRKARHLGLCSSDTAFPLALENTDIGLYM